MARTFANWVDLPNNRRIGYSLKKRDGVWVAQYIDPKGDYARKSTKQTVEGHAREATAELIRKAYGYTSRAAVENWDSVIEKVTAALASNNNRQETTRSYLKAIAALRKTVETNSPADITTEKAKQFKRDFISQTYCRSKGEGGIQRTRSHTTLNNVIRHLRSLWAKWLNAEFDMVSENPWLKVNYSEVDEKAVEIPEEQTVIEFLNWIRTEYRGFDLPIVFLETKMFLGCRLKDLCHLKVSQLKNGCIHFDSDTVKNRKARKVQLPPLLYARLMKLVTSDECDLLEPVYVWDAYGYGLLHCQQRMKKAVRTDLFYKPSLLYNFMQRLHSRFNATHANKIKSHDLRKRAITTGYASGVDVDATAKIFGLDPQTARKYYLALGRIDTAELHQKMASKLLISAAG